MRIVPGVSFGVDRFSSDAWCWAVPGALVAIRSRQNVQLVMRLLGVLMAAVALGSCYSAARTYRGFAQKSSDIQSVVLIHDALLFNDIEGTRDFINVDENLHKLDTIHAAISKIVRNKGYRVLDQTVASIGLTERPGTSLLVFAGDEDDSPGFFTKGKLLLKPTPIAVKSEGIEEGHIPSIGALHRHLYLESQSIEDMKGTYYSSYIRELSLPENSVLLVTQSVGRRVFTGKKTAEWMMMLLAGAISGETRGTPEHDETTHYLFILDSKTGELLWADTLEEVGGNRTDSSLQNGLKKLFNELPDRESR